MIRQLQAQGAPIGGIGVQEHGSQHFLPPAGGEAQGGYRLEPSQVLRRLDRLAELGLPIHLTEISARTADLEGRAEALETMFRVGFSHPQVEAILLWGFWERRHWMGPEAALVDAEWNLLPAGQRISRLLRQEWRTNMTARTDAAGVLTFRGFYGDYELRYPDAAGVERIERVELRP
jgi:GH35 family endo-1,4-beta-xylanase